MGQKAARLVHEAHESRDANLLREEDVLSGLGHRTIWRGNHEDAAVHLASSWEGLGSLRTHRLYI